MLAFQHLVKNPLAHCYQLGKYLEHCLLSISLVGYVRLNTHARRHTHTEGNSKVVQASISVACLVLHCAGKSDFGSTGNTFLVLAFSFVDNKKK